MERRTALQSRGAICVRVLRTSPSKGGRKESRVPIAPVGPVQQKSTGVGPQVNRSNAGFPCAVVYDLLRALPGDRAFLPPSSARCASIVANLTPASGRQDHTTSPSARSGVVSRRHPRPPHPTATFVTCATPLLSGGMRGENHTFPKNGREIFLRRGLARGEHIGGFREIRFLARRREPRKCSRRFDPGTTPADVALAL
jgi:hypothetical protein